MSPARLQSDVVFVDTSVIQGLQFKFGHSGLLRRFAGIAATGRIHVLMPDITKMEIEAHIRRAVRNAADEQKRFRKKVGFLNSPAVSEYGFLFGPVDEDGMSTRLIAEFHKFLSGARVEAISPDVVRPSEVFGRYFSEMIPFDTTEKKCEFPDAFVILALRHWHSSNGKPVYVESHDGDFRRACENADGLIYVSDLNVYLDLIESDDRELAAEEAIEETRYQYVQSLIPDGRPDLNREITRQFELLGFFFEDGPGDIDGIGVRSVEVRDAFAIETHRNTSRVELSVVVSYEAEVSYPDPGFLYYDEEEGIAHYFETVEETVERNEDVVVQTTVVFPSDDPSEAEFTDVAIVDKTDVGVDVHTPDWR